MATLNDLRTKGGVIVSVVIAVAMIVFIMSDLFGSGQSILASHRNRVGRIAGHNVGYQEYTTQSNYIKDIYSSLWGTTAFNNEQYDMIYNEAWNDLIMANSYKPSFEKLGLTISDAEQVDMIQGAYVSPVITSFFADPATGQYNPELLKNFLSQVDKNEQAYTLWSYIKKRISEQRTVSNFSALVAAGFSASDVDVNAGVEAANNASDLKVAVKPYYSIPDSLVKADITSSAIKKYYDNHKKLFRQGDAREVEYVVFNVEPSDEDRTAAKEAVDKLAAEFVASAAPMQFASANSSDRPDQRYYSRAQLSAEQASAADLKGQLYGPVLNGDTYTMSRLADVRMMSDTLDARHILLAADAKTLADSIVKALKGGANFAELAAKYSFDKGSAAKGGELGRFAPEQMIPEFSNALMAVSTGQVITVESQYGLHVAQLTYKSPAIAKSQIATITYKIDPSDATLQKASDEANRFIAAAKGTSEGFDLAVTDLGLSKRTARIRNTDRAINGLDNSRELIRWAYNNKKGAVSNTMEIDGDYIVANLKESYKEGYAPVKEVSNDIAQMLRNEAKVAYVAGLVKDAASIEEAAAKLGVEVVTADGVYGNSMNIPGVGPETALVGAASVAPQGKVSAPVKGMYGIYVFSVVNRTQAENATAQSEKVRQESSELYYLNERLEQALAEKSNIKDFRVKFF